MKSRVPPNRSASTKGRSHRTFLPIFARKPIGLVVGAVWLLAAGPVGGQTTLYWRSEAANGNWSEANNWWNGSSTQSPAGSEILRFDNTSQLTMNNDLSGSAANRFRIFFDSGSGARTISGATVNTFYDYGGNGPKIENNSANAQTINFPLAVGYSYLEVNPIDADITIGGNVNLNANQLRVWGNNSKVLTFGTGCTISGTGSLSINQNSTVIFQSAHTYSGDTYINAGTLRFNSGGSAANSTLRLGDTSGSAAATLSLASGANVGSTLVVRSGSSGTKTIASLASSGTATFSGSVSLDADATITSAAGGTFSFTGTEVDLKNQTLTVDNAGTVSIAAVLKNSTGSGKLTKTGAGTLTLSGNNRFSGGLTFSDGRINFNHNNAAGSGAITVNSAADEFVTSSGTVVLPNNISLDSGAAPKFYATSGNSLEQTGTISGQGGLTRDETGAGTVKLSGNNTFSGGVSWTSRGLRLNHKNALGTGTFSIGGGSPPDNTLTLTADSALTGADAVPNAITWNQDFTLAAVQNLEFSGAITMPASRQVTVNNGVTLTFSGAIQSTTAGLTKAGLGTLTLGAANNYSGNTTISAGTLALGAGGSIASSPTITVAAGATFNVSAVSGGFTLASGQTLQGAGTVVGAMSVNGTLSPGASVGSLTTGNQTWNGGGQYTWEINDVDAGAGTGWDLLNLGSGTLDVAANSGNKFTLKVTSLNGTSAGAVPDFSPDSSYTWRIAQASTVTGFDAGDFSIDTIAFVNDLQGGTFSIETDASGVNLKFTRNQAPTASNTNFTRAPGLTLKISIADLLAASTSDPDGHSRILWAVGTPSHGSVSTNGSYIFYTPSDNSADNFTYTVTDDTTYRAGDTRRTAQATINISVAAQSGIAQSINTSGGGGVTVNFAGIPGYAYVIQRATDVNFAENLTDLLTTNAPSNGLFSYTDETPPQPTAFYRLKQN